MKITPILSALTPQIKAIFRLRQSYDLSTTADENSQRMLNTLESRIVIPIHRYGNTLETMVIA